MSSEEWIFVCLPKKFQGILEERSPSLVRRAEARRLHTLRNIRTTRGYFLAGSGIT